MLTELLVYDFDSIAIFWNLAIKNRQVSEPDLIAGIHQDRVRDCTTDCLSILNLSVKSVSALKVVECIFLHGGYTKLKLLI